MPADLRDRHLVRIDQNNLDRITIDAPGKGKTVLARKDQNWTIANKNNAAANTGGIHHMSRLTTAKYSCGEARVSASKTWEDIAQMGTRSGCY